MPEALTESFCERCGTRYEFKAPTRLNPLRKTRGVVSGLRNYIMSQDALSDAVGDAIRSEEESLAARQLEAFHESFNFCIDCRQYTCVNCWNHDAGRCRACAPIAGTDDLLERFEASFQAQHPDRVQSSGAIAEPSTNGAALNGDAWPSTDLPAATNGHADLAWPEAELIGSSEPVAEAVSEMDVVFEAAAPAFEPEPEPETVDAVDAEVEPEPIYTPTEVEPQVVAEAEVEPQVVAEAEVEPQVVADAEVEPQVVAEAEPEWAESLEPEVAAVAEAEWIETTSQPETIEAVAPPEPAEEPQPVVWEADAAFELLPEEPPVAFVDETPTADAALFFEPEPEPEVVAEAELEPAPEPEPEVVGAAEVEPEPEPIRPALRPISDTILRMPRREPVPEEPRIAAEADDPAVAARRAQLDLLGLGDPGEGPVAPAPRTVLPYRSSGASGAPAAGQVRADGMAAGGSFWDASAREVASAMSQVGVQSCGQCGLSLSASARFCRRCGTRQARSA